MIIDTKAYTRAEWVAHVNDTEWTAFSSVVKKPIGITLHNTWRPLISQWSETDPGRINALNGLKSYYEGMGWHAGPHGFISRDFISGFSPIAAWGIHSTCFNHTHIGLEMVGDYEPGGEEFNSGDGAMVRDNAVFAIATLMLKLNLSPEHDLVFHRDCPADHHACPGSLVRKPDMIEAIRKEMGALSSAPIPPAAPDRYTVVAGDTLYSIARTHGVDLLELLTLNNIVSPFKILIGMSLKLK